MIRIQRWLSKFIIFFGAVAFTATASAGSIEAEYKIKAAYIYNFARYVEWPTSGGQVNVCLVGDAPFEAGVLDAIEQKSTSSLSIKFVRNVDASDVSRCQIVFIGADSNVSGVLSKTKNLPILTVSDAKNFVSKGGIIEFVLNSENKIKFSVNLNAANASQLKLNPQLLEIAVDVLR